MICLYCDEDIGDDPLARTVNGCRDWLHADCYIRMMVGSVGHQSKRCSCFGGDLEDPPGMTKHEAAHAAANVFYGMSVSSDYVPVDRPERKPLDG